MQERIDNRKVGKTSTKPEPEHPYLSRQTSHGWGGSPPLECCFFAPSRKPQKAIDSDTKSLWKCLPENYSKSRGSAERIWGEFFSWVRRILGKLPVNFSANFDGDFFPRVFRPCFFPGFQALKKIHAQNSRPEVVGIPLQFNFLEPNIFSRRFSAYWGDQKLFKIMLCNFGTGGLV